mmetsp:Transcript_4580/g.8750  ORF Transcript_4580/g.8750 Transcript_4580/m.8750 type:complete len:329 (-) Transcript_4580:6347-7333(-)
MVCDPSISTNENGKGLPNQLGGESSGCADGHERTTVVDFAGNRTWAEMRRQQRQKSNPHGGGVVEGATCDVEFQGRGSYPVGLVDVNDRQAQFNVKGHCNESATVARFVCNFSLKEIPDQVCVQRFCEGNDHCVTFCDILDNPNGDSTSCRREEANGSVLHKRGSGEGHVRGRSVKPLQRGQNLRFGEQHGTGDLNSWTDTSVLRERYRYCGPLQSRIEWSSEICCELSATGVDVGHLASKFRTFAYCHRTRPRCNETGSGHKHTASGGREASCFFLHNRRSKRDISAHNCSDCTRKTSWGDVLHSKSVTDHGCWNRSVEYQYCLLSA